MRAEGIAELSLIFWDHRELSQAGINILKIYVFQSSWDAKSDLIGNVIPLFTSAAPWLGRCCRLLSPCTAVPGSRTPWVRQEGCQHSRFAGLSAAVRWSQGRVSTGTVTHPPGDAGGDWQVWAGRATVQGWFLCSGSLSTRGLQTGSDALMSSIQLCKR